MRAIFFGVEGSGVTLPPITSSAETFLGQFIDAGIQGPQGLHRATVDPRQVKDGLGDLVQLLEGCRGPDVALARPHHHHDAVGAEQLGAVLEEGVGVFVPHRQLFVETRSHAQLRGENHHRRECDEQDEGRNPEPEEEIFQAFDEVTMLDMTIQPTRKPTRKQAKFRCKKRAARTGAAREERLEGGGHGCTRHVAIPQQVEIAAAEEGAVPQIDLPLVVVVEGDTDGYRFAPPIKGMVFGLVPLTSW